MAGLKWVVKKIVFFFNARKNFSCLHLVDSKSITLNNTEGHFKVKDHFAEGRNYAIVGQMVILSQPLWLDSIEFLSIFLLTCSHDSWLENSKSIAPGSFTDNQEDVYSLSLNIQHSHTYLRPWSLFSDLSIFLFLHLEQMEEMVKSERSANRYFRPGGENLLFSFFSSSSWCCFGSVPRNISCTHNFSQRALRFEKPIAIRQQLIIKSERKLNLNNTLKRRSIKINEKLFSSSLGIPISIHHRNPNKLEGVNWKLKYVNFEWIIERKFQSVLLQTPKQNETLVCSLRS